MKEWTKNELCGATAFWNEDNGTPRRGIVIDVKNNILTIEDDIGLNYIHVDNPNLLSVCDYLT